MCSTYVIRLLCINTLHHPSQIALSSTVQLEELVVWWLVSIPYLEFYQNCFYCALFMKLVRWPHGNGSIWVGLNQEITTQPADIWPINIILLTCHMYDKLVLGWNFAGLVTLHLQPDVHFISVSVKLRVCYCIKVVVLM